MDRVDAFWKWRLRPRNRGGDPRPDPGLDTEPQLPDEPAPFPNAQAAYDTLLKDLLNPAMRSLGFTGSGGKFALKSPTHWAQVGLQKSSYSDRDEVRFTANLSVANKDAWAAFRAAHPAMPAKPAPSSGYSGPDENQRIGSINGGDDKWWRVMPTSDLQAVADDFVADMTNLGLPWIRQRI